MTFDKMQISNILFKYNNNSDIILDIHNFQEFNDQVNFLLKRKLDQDANFNRDKPFKEKILSAYKYYLEELENIYTLGWVKKTDSHFPHLKSKYNSGSQIKLF